MSMSLTRAFTTKKVKLSLELAQEAKARAAMQRSNTTKAAFATAPAQSNFNSINENSGANAASAFRPKISAPLELIHTTNMLSYNAPDIYPRTATSISSSASTKSADDDSDSPASASTAPSSPPTSPDVAPEDRSISPEPNHLSCYFMPPGQAIPPSTIQAPVIPKRAPSHTKKASFEALNRKRSNSRLSNQSGRSVSTKASYTFSRSSSASTSTSVASHASMISQLPKIPATPVIPVAPALPPVLFEKPEPPQLQQEPHPFGQELAQVTEIAEEFGIREKLQIIDEEEQELLSRGLYKFTADAYLTEIQGLSLSFFNNEPTHIRPMATVWI